MAFQNICEMARTVFRARQRLVRTKPFAAVVGIGREAFFEYRAEDLGERVMHYAVAK